MEYNYRIYHIANEVRNKCILDINVLNGESVRSLDEYFFRFKKTAILVYGYLKLTTEPVKLSHLHNLFDGSHKLEFFDSKKHITNLEDENYSAVINKYVRNKYIWVRSTVELQGYIFDSKYLLMGNYQKVARKCARRFFNSHNFHYSNLFNKTRSTQKQLDFYNEYFINKRKIEAEFINKYLSKYNNPKLTFLFHYNKIEVYDEVSDLYLQIKLDFHGFYTAQILFSDNKKMNRTKEESRRLALNIIVKSPELTDLYRELLTIDGINYVNNYLNKLEALKLTPQYKELFLTYESIITDIRNREEACHFDNEYYINIYNVHNNYFEQTRINKVFRGDDIRVLRQVRFKHNGEQKNINLKSFRLRRDTDAELVDWFMMSNLLNIGHINFEHDTYEYELLSEGKNINYSLAFMKESVYDLAKNFLDYIEVQSSLAIDIEYHLKNKIKIEDTRDKYTNLKLENYNTAFERYSYDNNKSLYLENKDRLFAKRNRLVGKLVNKLNRTWEQTGTKELNL